MTKVWVVMGNDFPDSVFSSEQVAAAYVAKRKTESKEEMERNRGRMIYWRAYEFEVQA